MRDINIYLSRRYGKGFRPAFLLGDFFIYEK
jgi:hypothetical protein